MLGLIALGKLHNTLAALLGMSVVFAVSYLGRPFSNDLFIFDFRGALRYVDWNVIFLIMGMMIIIAVVERTGVFQWLAFAAYRLSRGRIWLLVIILMGITGIASATLDNVTTMLLMTPITVQIALALSLNPWPYSSRKCWPLTWLASARSSARRPTFSSALTPNYHLTIF